MAYKKRSGIYMIRNNVNDKCYIGQSVSVKKRMCHHRTLLKNGKHYNVHLQAAWNKYGSENFTFSIIEECSEELLNETEIFWIDFFDSIKDGYNLAPGGSNHTPSHRGPISDSHLKKLQEGFKKYIEEYGYPRSYDVVCLNTGEVFKTLVDAGKKYSIVPGTIGSCVNNERGYKSAGKLNGERLVWKKLDDYEQMSQIEVMETIKSVNDSPDLFVGRPCVCLDDGKYYGSLKEAGIAYDMKPGTIRSCCERHNQSHRGLSFAFAEDLEAFE